MLEPCRDVRAKTQIPLKAHQSEIDKEARVLAGLGKIGEECGHADDEGQPVLTHVAKGLKKRPEWVLVSCCSEAVYPETRRAAIVVTVRLYKETHCLDFDYAQ